MSYSNSLSTEEQKELAKEKVEKALAKINSDVISIFDNDVLPEFLRFAANFHYFDINNVLLIYKQRPTATFVASFKAWERFSIDNWGDANRPIFTTSQKGQGIGILVPYILKKKGTVPDDARSGQNNKVISYFDYHVVFVFDKEQTNKIPTPIMQWDLSKSETDSKAAFNAFKFRAPFMICFSEEEDYNRNFSFKENDAAHAGKDVLTLNRKDMFNYYKLCSNMVRIFTFKSLSNIKKKFSADEFEKIAECVAYMVASYFGFPTEQYVFFFAKSWFNDTDKMLDTLDIIQRSAHSLIETLEEEMAHQKRQMDAIDDMYDTDNIFEVQSSFVF